MVPRLNASIRAFQKVLATKNNHLYPYVRLPLALPAPLQRPYATRDSLPSTAPTAVPRRKVTVANDDGRVKWENLSRSEKAARTTQQTFNFSIIIVGVVMTGAVITLFYTEVLAPNSKTNQFNTAVNRIKASPQCTDLLGPSKKITAFGEPTWNKWARARPIAHTKQVDKYGVEHLVMHFNVSGPLNTGTVNLHMTRRPGEEFAYRYLALDVKGHERFWVENADKKAENKARETKIFGVRWN